jgi:hypothetical protein
MGDRRGASPSGTVAGKGGVQALHPVVPDAGAAHPQHHAEAEILGDHQAPRRSRRCARRRRTSAVSLISLLTWRGELTRSGPVRITGAGATGAGLAGGARADGGTPPAAAARFRGDRSAKEGAAGLREIVLRLLAKKPEERIATAEELSESLALHGAYTAAELTVVLTKPGSASAVDHATRRSVQPLPTILSRPSEETAPSPPLLLETSFPLEPRKRSWGLAAAGLVTGAPGLRCPHPLDLRPTRPAEPKHKPAPPPSALQASTPALPAPSAEPAPRPLCRPRTSRRPSLPGASATRSVRIRPRPIGGRPRHRRSGDLQL